MKSSTPRHEHHLRPAAEGVESVHAGPSFRWSSAAVPGTLIDARRLASESAHFRDERRRTCVPRLAHAVAKVLVQHVCTECGTASPRWLGKCPGCGAFGTLAEELHALERRSEARPGRRRRCRSARSRRARASGSRPACPSSTACSAAGSCPASLVLVGGEPGVGKSTLLLSALGAIARDGRRALLVTGEESAAQVSLRAARLGGAETVEILAETELETVCATLEQERPDVCVIDSVQTLHASELGVRAGIGRPGTRGRGPPAARREGGRRGDDPRRARDEGRRGRRAARARAPRRLRAPVRGRPLPRSTGSCARRRTGSGRRTSSACSR